MTGTSRWALPLLDAGQAQKEMTHNEALALLDLLVSAGVQAVGLDAPPPAPLAGQAWVVGAAPTGDWAGHPHALAGWTAGGWRFVPPREGLAVWSVSDAVSATYAGGQWRIGHIAATAVTISGVAVVGARQPAIATPSGGATADAEARAAVAEMLAALRAHGLIAA